MSVLRTIAYSAVLLLTGPALAHDAGAISVNIRPIELGGCSVRVIADPEHISLKLEPAVVLADGTQGVPAAAADLEHRLIATSTLSAGGKPVQLRPVCSPTTAEIDAFGEPAPGQRRVVFAFETATPIAEREVRWRCELPIGQYLVSFSRPGESEPESQWLEPGQTSRPFAPATPPRASAQTAGQVAATYLRLGFTHIVPDGLDHILFVLGLFFLCARAKPILWQVTAFTIAHSITLALSMYGIVRLPASIVEPAIAISIVCVAVENLFVREFRPRRVALVFAFGLLHGLGFAGVLAELGLPRERFLPALACFNIGVELGQLAVVGAATIAVGLWFSRRPWYRCRVAIPASLAIAAVGLFWTVDRLIP